MAIRREYTPYGALGEAAFAIGQAERARQQESMYLQQAMRLQERQMTQQNAMELARYSKQLELEFKKRALAWEVEKAEQISRNNFALDEEKHRIEEMQKFQEQLQKEQNYRQALKELQDAGYTPGTPTYEGYKLQLALKHLGFSLQQPKSLTFEQQLGQQMAERLGRMETLPAGGAKKLTQSTKQKILDTVARENPTIKDINVLRTMAAKRARELGYTE